MPKNKKKKQRSSLRLRNGQWRNAKMKRRRTQSLPIVRQPEPMPMPIAIDPRASSKDTSLQMSMHHSLFTNQIEIHSAMSPQLAACYKKNILDYLTKDNGPDPEAVATAEAAKRISQGEWLNDVGLDDFMLNYCKKTQGQMVRINCGRFRGGKINDAFCDSLKSRPKESSKLKNADFIICAINHNINSDSENASNEDNHWSLMVMSKMAKEEPNKVSYALYCLDSLNQTHTHPGFRAEGLKLLRALWDDRQVELTPAMSYKVPVQSNSNDCGVAVCYYFERLYHLFRDQKLEDIKQGAYLKVYGRYANTICVYAGFRAQILKTFHTWHCCKLAQSNLLKQKSLCFQYQPRATDPRGEKCLRKSVIDLTLTPEPIAIPFQNAIRCR